MDAQLASPTAAWRCFTCSATNPLQRSACISCSGPRQVAKRALWDRLPAQFHALEKGILLPSTAGCTDPIQPLTPAKPVQYHAHKLAVVPARVREAIATPAHALPALQARWREEEEKLAQAVQAQKPGLQGQLQPPAQTVAVQPVQQQRDSGKDGTEAVQVAPSSTPAGSGQGPESGQHMAQADPQSGSAAPAASTPTGVKSLPSFSGLPRKAPIASGLPQLPVAHGGMGGASLLPRKALLLPPQPAPLQASKGGSSSAACVVDGGDGDSLSSSSSDGESDGEDKAGKKAGHRSTGLSAAAGAGTGRSKRPTTAASTFYAGTKVSTPGAGRSSAGSRPGSASLPFTATQARLRITTTPLPTDTAAVAALVSTGQVQRRDQEIAVRYISGTLLHILAQQLVKRSKALVFALANPADPRVVRAKVLAQGMETIWQKMTIGKVAAAQAAAPSPSSASLLAREEGDDSGVAQGRETGTGGGGRKATELCQAAQSYVHSIERFCQCLRHAACLELVMSGVEGRSEPHTLLKALLLKYQSLAPSLALPTGVTVVVPPQQRPQTQPVRAVQGRPKGSSAGSAGVRRPLGVGMPGRPLLHPVARARGRPRVVHGSDDEDVRSINSVSDSNDEDMRVVSSSTEQRRGKGRPPAPANGRPTATSAAGAPFKRPRGRPRKDGTIGPRPVPVPAPKRALSTDKKQERGQGRELKSKETKARDESGRERAGQEKGRKKVKRERDATSDEETAGPARNHHSDSDDYELPERFRGLPPDVARAALAELRAGAHADKVEAWTPQHASAEEIERIFQAQVRALNAARAVETEYYSDEYSVDDGREAEVDVDMAAVLEEAMNRGEGEEEEDEGQEREGEGREMDPLLLPDSPTFLGGHRSPGQAAQAGLHAAGLPPTDVLAMDLDMDLGEWGLDEEGGGSGDIGGMEELLS